MKLQPTCVKLATGLVLLWAGHSRILGLNQTPNLTFNLNITITLSLKLTLTLKIWTTPAGVLILTITKL